MMRLRLGSTVWLSALSLILLLPESTAARGDGFLERRDQQLPACAAPCLLEGLSNSGCADLSNQTCLCASQSYAQAVTACVTQNCTVRDSLITKNVTETMCHAPVRDKTPLITDVAIILGVISGVFVVLRLIFKIIVTKTGMAGDDWLIFATLLSGVPGTIISVRGTAANGLGKDIWTLPFETITAFGRYFYVLEILYFVQVTLLKSSLLYFYLRIFPDSRTRYVLWATLAFNGVYGASFVVAAIFSCTPISYFWVKWDGEHVGTCINLNVLGWTHAAISIALDFWMLAIPLSQLPGLQLHWKKKIGVAIMFFVGTFVTVVSIMRLQSLVSFANSQNPTWDNWEVTNWSTIEVNVGIICACLPSARLLLVRLFPRLGSSTRNRSHKHYENQNTAGSFHLGIRSRSAVEGGPAVDASKVGDRTITYHKSFTVQYSDNDEASLVQMSDPEYPGRS